MSTDPATGAIAVDGLANLRDLGGLRRRDGSFTPSGVFFRSENVDAVTESGWDMVRAHGIRTVVDLRQPREIERDRGARPDWLHTVRVDLDGLENQEFWKDYWSNGLVGTALYYLPHLDAMPQRAGAALSAIVSAPAGGVLFHCMGGRDRTGMIAMLLLAAAGVESEEIVSDYLETVRLGPQRAALRGVEDDEPLIEEFCRGVGTTTESAFRDQLAGLDVEAFLARAGLGSAATEALRTWRGTLVPTGSG